MARKGIVARLARALLLLVLGFFAASALAVLVLRWIDPWTSAVMLESRIEAWRKDDAKYRLRQDWVDRQLYHLGALVSWAPPGRLVPYVAGGPDLYVPIAVGGHLSAGGKAELGGGWVVRAHVDGLVADTGLGWGVGAGLGR